MTIEQILDNPDLIKRFCRDYNVPVSTYNGYWFPKQLSTLSIHNMNYVEKWDEFCDELANFDSAEEYFQYYNDVKDVVIKYIQNHHEYECFNNMTFDTGKYFNKKELYTPENHEKNFISIDLKKANYTIMNMYCRTLFKEKSWEKFLNDFANAFPKGDKVTLIVGDKEAEDKTVSVRSRKEGDLGVMEKADIYAKLVEEDRTKKV